jgi:ribosomal-protein-alanine N-acetyltransferase
VSVTPTAPGPVDSRVPVLVTERLVLSPLEPADAAFVVELLNEPSFLRYIGDKGVRTLEDARRYVETGPMASYARFGFGLLRVEKKAPAEPIGICGLLKRETLEDVDLGFALLPRFWSQGYAHEAARAVLDHARQHLGLRRVLAITSPDNEASIGLLGRLGFGFERMARLSEGAAEVRVFSLRL